MASIRSLTPIAWHRASFGERLSLDVISTLLWPLPGDERMTVLMTLLSSQILDAVENEDQIDGIIEMLRIQLKLTVSEAKPSRN